MGKRLLVIVGAVALLAVAFLGSIIVASELGGEVVVLETARDDGSTKSSHLWVVEDGGALWLRCGIDGASWVENLERAPVVTLERGGRRARYRATAIREPAVRDRIHALMADKYGMADRWISMIRDGEGSVAIRLDTLESR